MTERGRADLSGFANQLDRRGGELRGDAVVHLRLWWEAARGATAGRAAGGAGWDRRGPDRADLSRIYHGLKTPGDTRRRRLSGRRFSSACGGPFSRRFLPPSCVAGGAGVKVAHLTRKSTCARVRAGEPAARGEDRDAAVRAGGARSAQHTRCALRAELDAQENRAQGRRGAGGAGRAAADYLWITRGRQVTEASWRHVSYDDGPMLADAAK